MSGRSSQLAHIKLDQSEDRRAPTLAWDLSFSLRTSVSRKHMMPMSTIASIAKGRGYGGCTLPHIPTVVYVSAGRSSAASLWSEQRATVCQSSAVLECAGLCGRACTCAFCRPSRSNDRVPASVCVFLTDEYSVFSCGKDSSCLGPAEPNAKSPLLVQTAC